MKQDAHNIVEVAQADSTPPKKWLRANDGLPIRNAIRSEIARAVSSGVGLSNSVDRKLVVVLDCGCVTRLTLSISKSKEAPRQSTGFTVRDCAKALGTGFPFGTRR